MAQEQPVPGATSSAAPDDRLDSWKEIAAYLKRDIRTVKRWEKTEGMPVHRHQHQRQATVYAYKTELEEWRETGRGQVAEKEHARAIHWQRIILAGLLGGFVSNVLQYIVNRLFLAREWRTALEPLGLVAASGTEVRLVLFVLILAGGIFAAWLYVMLRPRFGPGPATAALAGFVFWLLSAAFPVVLWSVSMGKALPLIPPALLATHLGIHLVVNVAQTGVAGWFIEK